MNIPNIFVETAKVKIWLSMIKKKYGDNWKLAVWKSASEDGMQTQDIHPLVKKHLNRKKP